MRVTSLFAIYFKRRSSTKEEGEGDEKEEEGEEVREEEKEEEADFRIPKVPSNEDGWSENPTRVTRVMCDDEPTRRRDPWSEEEDEPTKQTTVPHTDDVSAIDLRTDRTTDQPTAVRTRPRVDLLRWD